MNNTCNERRLLCRVYFFINNNCHFVININCNYTPKGANFTEYFNKTYPDISLASNDTIWRYEIWDEDFQPFNDLHRHVQVADATEKKLKYAVSTTVVLFTHSTKRISILVMIPKIILLYTNLALLYRGTASKYRLKRYIRSLYSRFIFHICFHFSCLGIAKSILKIYTTVVLANRVKI